MKAFNYILLSLLLFVLLSCSQNSQKDADKNQTLYISEKIVTNLQDNQNKEDFYIFLEKFNNDESFQMKRIIFPITILSSIITRDGMVMEKETISKYDWELLDLTYDSTYITRDYDKYEQLIAFRNDSAVVTLRGIDNGIYADYYFKLIDNQWFLVTLDE